MVGNKNEKYNICLALREMMEDSWKEGWSKGIVEGISEKVEGTIEMMIILVKENRLKDLHRVIAHLEYKEQLYQENARSMWYN